MRRVAGLLVLCGSLCMCAAPSAEAPPATAPATAPAPAAAPAPAPATPSAATTGDDTPARRQARRVAAGAELDRAQADLEASASDCAAACRALASMDRATTHLCALADDSDDQRRCEDARQRLTAARARVRASCGACGP